jgi:hypothetical protein
MTNRTLKDPLKSILKQQTKKVQRKGEKQKTENVLPFFDNEFLKQIF